LAKSRLSGLRLAGRGAPTVPSPRGLGRDPPARASEMARSQGGERCLAEVLRGGERRRRRGRDRHPYLPCSRYGTEVVGLESVQMGWFNASRRRGRGTSATPTSPKASAPLFPCSRGVVQSCPRSGSGAKEEPTISRGTFGNLRSPGRLKPRVFRAQSLGPVSSLTPDSRGRWRRAPAGACLVFVPRGSRTLWPTIGL
jgi:hypothetical protein